MIFNQLNDNMDYLKKIVLLLIIIIGKQTLSIGQNNSLYVIDSIPYYDSLPFIHNLPLSYFNLQDDEMESKITITNPAEIKNLGHKGVDTIVVILTKVFVKRAPDFKKIPDQKLFSIKGRLVYFHNRIYSGPYIETKMNGKIVSKGNYKNGLIDGNVIIYDNIGGVKKEVSYINGYGKGRSKVYWTNGAVRTIEDKDDKGITITEYSSKGILLSKRKYDNYYNTVYARIPRDIRKQSKPQTLEQYFKNKDNYSNYLKSSGGHDSKIRPTSYEVFLHNGLTMFYYSEIEGCIQMLDSAITREPFDIDTRICRLYLTIYKFEHNKYKSITENSGSYKPTTPENVVVNETDYKKICEDVKVLVNNGYGPICEYMDEDMNGSPVFFYKVDINKVKEIYCKK